MEEELKDNDECVEDDVQVSEETPSVEPLPEDISDEELEGRIFEKKRDKEPLFVIEPKKEGCERDDSLFLLSKKVGFTGLVLFLILSIVFGAITKIWANSLNLLFMGLAVLSYAIQDMIHLKAISKCPCPSCNTERKKLKNIIILCVTIAAVIIVLFGVRQFATF